MSGWPPGGEAYDVQPMASPTGGTTMPGSVILPGERQYGPSVTCVMGVDPGATTGVCHLQIATPCNGEPPYITSRLVFGCNALAVFPLMQFLMEINEGAARIIAAGERFVPGRGAGARGPGAAVTRDVIQELAVLPVAWHWRSAADVKPWATDDRLKAAGLYEITAKMRDARDGARHALFAACHDAGLPDPLSRKARRTTTTA